ncbi:unnamed protein product, partial [Allacma fusca]
MTPAMSALSNYLIESSNPSEQSVESYHRSLSDLHVSGGWSDSSFI